MNTSKRHIAIFLSSRILLMLCLQSLMALILIQSDHAFERAGTYWATQLTIVNVFLLWLMIRAGKRETRNVFDLFKTMSKKDTVFFLKVLIPLVIVAMGPNMILSILLYQDPQIGATFLLSDMPLGLLLMNVTLFPVLQGLVELPFYFLFVMPMIKTKTTNPWIFIGLPVLFLSIQHAFMPFRADFVYMIYRSLMFLPFALLIGWLVHKRPRIMPYLVGLHVLMNASLFLMLLIP